MVCEYDGFRIVWCLNRLVSEIVVYVCADLRERVCIYAGLRERVCIYAGLRYIGLKRDGMYILWSSPHGSRCSYRMRSTMLHHPRVLILFRTHTCAHSLSHMHAHTQTYTEYIFQLRLQKHIFIVCVCIVLCGHLYTSYTPLNV